MSSTRRFSAFRLVSATVLGALILVLTGDRGVYTAVPGGIDPLEVLNLVVRPNALVVLDSSGSMREMPDADYLTDGSPTDPVEGEVAGDDSTSKMAQAKAALRAVVQANQEKVSFQFGRYVQDANSYGPEAENRFLYTRTCGNSTSAADVACRAETSAIVVDCGNNAACGTFGLWRENTTTFRRVVGVPPAGTTVYHLFANRFYNGQHLRVRTAGTNGTTASAGTPGTVQLNVTPVAPADHPHVWVQNINTSNVPVGADVKFTFKGMLWNKGNAAASCGGFESLVGLAPCTDNLQIDVIGPHLNPELEIDTTNGNIVGYTNQAVAGTPGAAQRPPMRGIRASGFTPIAETMIDFKGIFNGLWTSSISTMTPKPRTFVIFLTDGDDTCTGPATSQNTTGTDADNRALRAAYRAQLLYERIVATEPASSVLSFVVVFGTGASASRGNWIAWGGSGMNQAGVSCGIAGKPACIPITGTGGAARWSAIPTAAHKTACATCRDAFLPASVDDLTSALQTALDQGQAQGEFSDQQSITESIYELAGGQGVSPGPITDPLDPETRYGFTLPVLLQSTFEMPDFKGHLNAFRNLTVAGVETSQQLWDAGQLLTDRVANSLGTAQYSFTELRGGLSTTPMNIGAATAPGTIRRRIYTTTRNGYFLTGTNADVANLIDPLFEPPGQIALWPPALSVDTTGPITATGSPSPGLLDDELGILGLTVAQMQTEFGACMTSGTVATLPPQCTGAAPGTLKEARQIILAHMAGAELVKGGALNLPVRHPVTRALQFQRRAWLLAESTLAAPAIVTPPLQPPTSTHASEYLLYRDGPRDGSGNGVEALSSGFGLRNPDKDQTSAAASGVDARTTLKPVMSMVYHGANDMLHAFKAADGEEAWAFVPYDQLGKLRERIRPQARDPHTYVIAAPVRVGDVFVPGPFSKAVGSTTVSGAGVWRTVILVGRGIAGKYVTAIDVTSPARFNQNALDTAPPIVMWNRGNPDTQDGSLAGTVNHDTTDYNAYLKMGQTWSVPTIGFVTAAQNVTARRSTGVEYVAYMGSGYGSGPSAASEGSTIFALDVLTGDVVAASDIGDRASMGYENAVVASPAGFAPDQLVFGRTFKNAASSLTTRVYVGDIHGRVWRLLTDDPTAPPVLFGDLGANQPVANPVALLDYAGTTGTKRPHIYVEAGNDNRVTPPPNPTPPFRLFALRDDDLTVDPNGADAVNGPATLLFVRDLPDGYRGTTQPATAFGDALGTLGRVFFAGTRFNLPGTANAPDPPPCRSSFDSIVFALAAQTGQAAYDLNSAGDDSFFEIPDERVQAVRVAGGRLVLDKGLAAQNPPPPPAPPQEGAVAPGPFSDVFVGAFLADGVTPRIQGLVPFKLGSAVCR